jgi:hypothetical protein
MVAASFSGRDFAKSEGSHDIVMFTLASIVPFFTYMLSAYDGSLLALLIVSVAAMAVFLAGSPSS